MAAAACQRGPCNAVFRSVRCSSPRKRENRAGRTPPGARPSGRGAPCAAGARTGTSPQPATGPRPAHPQPRANPDRGPFAGRVAPAPGGRQPRRPGGGARSRASVAATAVSPIATPPVAASPGYGFPVVMPLVAMPPGAIPLVAMRPPGLCTGLHLRLRASCAGLVPAGIASGRPGGHYCSSPARCGRARCAACCVAPAPPRRLAAGFPFTPAARGGPFAAAS